MAKKKPGVPGTKKPHRQIKLRVIPEPEDGTRSVIVYTGEGTVAMRGSGNVVMECGSCGSPLLVGVPVANVQNLVFRCKNCGAFNETLA